MKNKRKMKAPIILLKIKRLFLGLKGSDGLVFKLLIYSLLVGIGFVFILPLIKMLSSSFKSLQDLLDPTLGYLPSELYLDNYKKAFAVLDYKSTLIQSLTITVIPAVVQTIATAIIGYGFARFQFPLKKLWFALVLTTFIIPPQVLMIPRYLMYKNLGILGSLLALVLPAIFGQGFKSAIFILIFYQFFKMMPKALEEAAKIDGASNLRIFATIAIPMAVPAIITSFIFSFVWYWNETYLINLYLSGSMTTLPMELQKFTQTYSKLYPMASEAIEKLNEGIKMSGTLLTILPVLIIYFVLQRWFVEGVDRSGITGE